MKTIESIIDKNKKVYVRMSSEKTCKRFFAQAEKEGFTFGGEKPGAKNTSDLIAVLPGKELCYVATIGRIAARSHAKSVVVYDGEDFILNSNKK